MSLKITDLACIKCGVVTELIAFPITKLFQREKKRFTAPMMITTTTSWTESTVVPICRNCEDKFIALKKNDSKILLISTIILGSIFVAALIGSFFQEGYLKYLHPIQLTLFGIFFLGLLIFPINRRRYKTHKNNINYIVRFGLRFNKYNEADRVIQIKINKSSGWVYFDDWARSVIEERYGIVNDAGDDKLDKKFCTNCGEEIKSDQDFCGNCGFKKP